MLRAVPMHARLRSFLAALPLIAAASLHAAAPSTNSPGDRALADYFRAETAKLSDACLTNIQTVDDWNQRRGTYRQQLFDMLGLHPLPPRGELKPVVTGRVERDDFAVENLHFQSLPGLYVTANLYLPKNQPKPAPAILYLSGHGPVISNGVSYGNKVSYQHHGVWFARNGYACLVLDTVQLGEIAGLHHGTYREGLWWWNARGYTPAGVEAWNSLRALDYLETRPEVDASQLGATGRSGGGAYSWWIAALDDRIKAAAPVAGITDLHNHIVDGTVEGHCDCMFTVNTHRWDYPQVAALVAPRPLLIVNTDADSIFPLDGVVRLHAKVRRIYELHKAGQKLGLVIGPGPHKDTQDLQVPVFRWFNQHLKGSDPLIALPAEKQFTPQELKVFATLPTDAINTNIHETFVPAAPRALVPKSLPELSVETRLSELSNSCFAGWLAAPPSLDLKRKFSGQRNGVELEAWDFNSQEHVRLRLYVAQRAGGNKPGHVELSVLDAAGFGQLVSALRADFAGELAEELALPSPRPAHANAFAALRERLGAKDTALAWFAPRGIGLTTWDPNPRKQVQIRRRFMLLGQTLDGMRVWDIRRAFQAARALPGKRSVPIGLRAEGDLACDALYAALFEPDLAQLDLWRVPPSHRTGPDYLNVLRHLDVPEAVALANTRVPITLHDGAPADWAYSAAVAKALGRDKQFVVERQ